MCLIALTAQWYYAVQCPILTGWLTHLLESCNEFHGWFFSQWPPQILLSSWRGICCKHIFRFEIHSCFFLVSPSLVCLNFIKSFSLSSVCLIFFWISYNCFFLCMGSARIFCACWSCLYTLLEFSMLFYFKYNCWFRTFSSPVDHVSFISLFCLCYYNSLALDSCCDGHGVGCLFSLDFSNVYWCGNIHMHIDG